MKPEDVREINRSRLEDWRTVMDEDNTLAAVVVGVDATDESGLVRVCAPLDADTKAVARVLLQALQLVLSEEPTRIPPR